MYDEGILTKQELSVLQCLAKKHLDTLGECDLYIVINRTKEKLFENWLSRNRIIEQNQEAYLNYHYSHYYDKLKEIFKTYNVNPNKIYYMNHIDLKNPHEYQQLIQDLTSYKEV
jgi:deoxyadenosine/deoxycytidine kinase